MRGRSEPSSWRPGSARACAPTCRSTCTRSSVGGWSTGCSPRHGRSAWIRLVVVAAPDDRRRVRRDRRSPCRKSRSGRATRCAALALRSRAVPTTSSCSRETRRCSRLALLRELVDDAPARRTRWRRCSRSSRTTRSSTDACCAAGDGTLAAIVEYRDATDEQRAVREVNSSIYVFRAASLWPVLDRLTPHNAQGELYLTDSVGILAPRVDGSRCTREEIRWRPRV